jgi:hypothetical protein
MRVKNYNRFLESNLNFSIYDYFNYLKYISWSDKINESEFINHVEHFIGKEQWSLINEHFQRAFDILDAVDIDDINDRMYDIFDEYLYHDMSYVIRTISYGDIDRYNNEPKLRYNGLMSVTETDKNSKLHIICNFLKDLLYKVLWITDHGHSGFTKKPQFSMDQLYVTSDKFSIKNFKNIDVTVSATPFSLKRYLKMKSEFSIERYLDMYRPSIYISVGSSMMMSAKISKNKITKEFQEVLPSIISDLNYDTVIWPYTNSQQDIEIYDFDIKILLIYN